MFQPENKSPVQAFKKLVRMSISMLRWGFNPSKCKTEAKLATARIKLLRNKRQAQVRQMRRDIAALLQSGNDDTARIRVEHVIREQNVMAANEIIELFCEQVVVRLSIIAKQRDCPADLKEGISSLIYASQRCSDIPELSCIRDIFEKKYGKDFVSAATDLRPNSGVNRLLIEKLSVRKPTGEFKLKILKEIAKEYQVEWDTTESELELLKPPEEVLEGPRSFVSAGSMPLPVKPTLSHQDSAPNDPRSHADKRRYSMNFTDTASAAQAAAEAAEKAASAAQAAAVLAQQSSCQSGPTACYDDLNFGPSKTNRPQRQSLGSTQSVGMSSSSVDDSKRRTTFSTCQAFDDYMDSDNMDSQLDNEKSHRRHSYAAHKVHHDIKFDDSDGFDTDGDDEDEITQPPTRPPPVVPAGTDQSEENEPHNEHFVTCKTNQGPRVHPKLPDYEDLAARFEALKSRRS